ncbi:MAG: tetratricopeptide repeat protein [Prolixibacteraceae bacterium]
MAEDLIIEANRLWKEGDSEEALKLLNHESLLEHPQANFLSGKIYYNNQKWGLALNSFRRCLKLDPDNTAAQTYVDLILNILGFFHADQFNP